MWTISKRIRKVKEEGLLNVETYIINGMTPSTSTYNNDHYKPL